MLIVLLLLLGIVAGAVSGLVGIGGGIIIVPALVLGFGFNQASAQGTSLAMMVPPIGILAVWQYFQGGHVDLKVAVILAVGFILGSLLGAKFALNIPPETLKRVFGVFLLIIAVKMLLGK